MRDPLNAEWNRAFASPPIIDFGAMNAIFANFLDLVGLPIAIIDLDGHVLASSRWQRICVEFHRVNPGTLSRCLESDVNLSQAMADGKPYAIYRCRNGLTDCATPIVVEDIHVANLFVGQFLLAPPDPEEFRRQQEEFGFDPQAYAEALSEVPIVSEDRLPAILRLMGGFAEQIGRQSLAEQRVRAAYEEVERQVADRTRELAETHQRLHKIADHVPGVVFQFMRRADGGYCVPYVSDAFSAMFGAAPDEVRDDAAQVFAAAHPDDLASFEASVADSAESLTPWRHEFRLLRPDGVVRWVGGEALPQREADGATLWHGFISDITHRKRTEMLLEARLQLADRSFTLSLHDLLVATLDATCELTGAETGFYHFLLPDQSTLSLQAWSTRTTREFCRAVSDPSHYDVDAAGVWADAVRLRRSVVYNDYTALEHRRGLPEGHAPVLRLMSVPIFRDGRIVAVIGVGNKRTDFDADDLGVVETLADLAWDLADRKRAEEALAERNTLVQRRYESLRALNEIAGLPAIGHGHQISRALALGARHLGLPFGLVARIDGERYFVEYFSAPPEAAGFATGQEFHLGDTFCAITVCADDVVAIPHVAQSDHAAHPCHRIFGLEAYIAVPVRANGKVFGTVNFSSPQPFARDFDEGDFEFMRLLGRWVGSFLERRQAQAEVEAAKETAEERARALAHSNADLEQFAYVASHDLRQPLRMVSSYLGLIERRYASVIDDDGREFIGYARDGALQMDRLILDLLEYSRVGRDDAPEPVDLAGLAAEAGGYLGPLAEEAGATVEIASDPAPTVGNRSELVRLFQNLVGNAVKYRDPARPPRITVGWRQEGGEWLVSVTDNGIGIASEFAQDIFKIFRRLHSSSEYEGTGIGLAVCQKIVTHHHGRIWVDSRPGEGSTFKFTLPAAAS